MIKLDLVTGFLGAGKTTFIIEYVKQLSGRGKRVAVVVNDHGAINVDRMLLEEAVGGLCHIEMVIGGDMDCHKRRLKTKLISLALGMGEIEDGTEVSVGKPDRVIIEPSGVFDPEEFFNLIHEAPLTKWYEIGNVIALFDAKTDRSLSKESRYVIASQAANAGILLVTHAEDGGPDVAEDVLDFVNDCMSEFRCDRSLKNAALFLQDNNPDDIWNKIYACGYAGADLIHLPIAESGNFDSKFFFHAKLPEDELERRAHAVMTDKNCGNIIRLKGFQKTDCGDWLEVNATEHEVTVKRVSCGQEVYILIGEAIDEKNILKYFE